MNTSFTSGPWVATNSHTIESKGKKAIRIATLCLSGRPSGQPWKIESFLPEAEANARLIAAAPSLYAALHNLVARGLIDTDCDHYDEAIEALNLATGQP